MGAIIKRWKFWSDGLQYKVTVRLLTNPDGSAKFRAENEECNPKIESNSLSQLERQAEEWVKCHGTAKWEPWVLIEAAYEGNRQQDRDKETPGERKYHEVDRKGCITIEYTRILRSDIGTPGERYAELRPDRWGDSEPERGRIFPHKPDTGYGTGWRHGIGSVLNDEEREDHGEWKICLPETPELLAGLDQIIRQLELVTHQIVKLLQPESAVGWLAQIASGQRLLPAPQAPTVVVPTKPRKAPDAHAPKDGHRVFVPVRNPSQKPS